MIIWSGYGFIIFIIVFINSLLAELISEAATHNDNLYQENYIPLGASFLISGAVIYSMNIYFQIKRANNQGTRIFDKAMIANTGHHLFFIPFRYWPFIMIMMGILTIGYEFAR